MTLPAFLFGSIIGILLGAVFHLWKGGSFIRLILYIIISTAGFWAGHWISMQNGWDFLGLGPIRLGSAIVGSILFLGVGHWLSLIQIQEQQIKK